MYNVAQSGDGACVEVLRVTERPAVCVDANDSLLSAIRRLRDNHVHRVLVIDSDTGNAVHVLTQRSILEFLASRVSNSPFFSRANSSNSTDIFRCKSLKKRLEIETWLQWTTNRK